MTNEGPEAIGARIRETRLGSGLSQAELGRRVHHTGQWVYGIEHNRHTPSPSDLVLLSAALGASVEWLVVGDQRESEFIARLRLLEPSLDDRGKRAMLALVAHEIAEGRLAEDVEERSAIA